MENLDPIALAEHLNKRFEIPVESAESEDPPEEHIEKFSASDSYTDNFKRFKDLFFHHIHIFIPTCDLKVMK